MLKLIIRKANKVVHCGPTACSERRALKSHRLWFIHIFSNQRLETELLKFCRQIKEFGKDFIWLTLSRSGKVCF